MLVYYDIAKINSILHDFYLATGVRIDLYGDNFTSISYSQHEICNYCKFIQNDGACKNACTAFDNALLKRSRKSMKSEQDICPFGLTNIVTPIIYNEAVIGYLFFGQMRMQHQFSEPDNATDNPYLYKASLSEHYSSLPLFDAEKAKSVSNLAQMLIGQILTDNMLKPDSDEMMQKAVAYINDNLEKELSIEQISKSINVSKSVLYSKFHSRLNCTIGEYINKKRIERSIELLTRTNLSIEDVAQKSGFLSASYYTKTFKQQMGITPLKFKKSR